MSAAVLNIVIGLVTTVLSGGSVWLWQQAKHVRSLRLRAAVFGISPRTACLIVIPNKFDKVGSTAHHDVHTLIEIARLISDVGAEISVESGNDFRGSNGDRTEFCVGGPTANPRSAGHLTTHLPGVSIRRYDPGAHDSLAFVVDDQQFPCDHGNQEHALVAKFTPPEARRPVILICGQSSIANRAAIHFLKREAGNLPKVVASTDRFCIVVRVASIGTYGYHASTLASDVSAAAFARQRPAAPAEKRART